MIGIAFAFYTVLMISHCMYDLKRHDVKLLIIEVSVIFVGNQCPLLICFAVEICQRICLF